MAIRGGKIHNTLFGLEVEEPVREEDLRGRSPELMEQRNEHLLCRYWWYAQDGKTTYDWIVERLKREFYLSSSTIGQILAAYTDRIAKLKQQNLTARQLAKRYPFFNWRK